MIPHIIHYCWFGRGEKSALIKKCIASWEKMLPGYEFMEWTEDNFDVNATLFTRQAYEAKRYAYVSDYARLCALETYGGVYLDTDEELLRDISPLLEQAELVAGFESPEYVMVGLLAAAKGHPLIREFRDYYAERPFLGEDGSVAVQPNPRVFTALLRQRGLVLNGQKQTLPQGICIWPVETFCAREGKTLQYHITENTYGVQYYAASWMSPKDKFKWAIRKAVARRFGPRVYTSLLAFYQTLRGKKERG